MTTHIKIKTDKSGIQYWGIDKGNSQLLRTSPRSRRRRRACEQRVLVLIGQHVPVPTKPW